MIENRQVLINLHTANVTIPDGSLLELGEIAVQHNDTEAALYIKKNDGSVAKFVDVTAVDSKVNAEKVRAEAAELALSGAIDTERVRAEGEESALAGRIGALEAISGQSHVHDNKAVLDGISSEKVSAWDAAEQNAKDYTDTKLADYATKSHVTEQIVSAMTGGEIELTGYAKEEEAKEWDANVFASAVTVSKEWVNEQNFLTEHQDISNLATKGEVATAEQNAKDYADGLAGNYEVAGAAATAEQNAKDYADGLADNYEVAGAAATAEQNAKDYADGLAGNYAAKSYESKVDTLVGSDSDKTARAIAAEEVAKVVANADADFDTLKEIADWIQNDTTGAASMANDIANLKAIDADARLDSLEAISGQSHVHDNKAVLDGITSEKVSAWDAAEKNAKDYADGLAGNYDAAGAASNALADAKTWVGEQNFLTEHQDISNLATKDEVATAEQNAKDYADGLVMADGVAKFDEAGAAATAEQNAKDYADGLAGNYDAAGAAATAEQNAKDYADGKITALRIDCGTF